MAAKCDRGLPFRTESAIAKLVCAENGFRVVDRSMQIHGGLGVAKDLPLERWFRKCVFEEVARDRAKAKSM